MPEDESITAALVDWIESRKGYAPGCCEQIHELKLEVKEKPEPPETIRE